MTSTANDWESRLGRLADELVSAGKLRSPEWISAFRSVPRHVLVPKYFEQDTNGWTEISTADDEGLKTVYSNTALFTDVDDSGRGVSSSSMPGLMTRMLEMLDIADGDRILEVGTGTGYNAALLCARLGAHNVFSVDIDYVEDTRKRLLGLGFSPTLETRDGREGMPEHAPFDRIMSTVAVRTIPADWIGQVRDDGLILADIKLATTAGNLVLLKRRGEVAEGKFDRGYASFMGMRTPGAEEPSVTAPRTDYVSTSNTDLPAFPWENSVPWFLAHLTLPINVTVGKIFHDDGRDKSSILTGSDGSWARASVDEDDGHRTVTQAGPVRIWDAIESGFEAWEDADRPTWGRLGLTAMADGSNTVWIDEPTSIFRWDIEGSK